MNRYAKKALLGGGYWQALPIRIRNEIVSRQLPEVSRRGKNYQVDNSSDKLFEGFVFLWISDRLGTLYFQGVLLYATPPHMIFPGTGAWMGIRIKGRNGTQSVRSSKNHYVKNPKERRAGVPLMREARRRCGTWGTQRREGRNPQPFMTLPPCMTVPAPNIFVVSLSLL